MKMQIVAMLIFISMTGCGGASGDATPKVDEEVLLESKREAEKRGWTQLEPLTRDQFEANQAKKKQAQSSDDESKMVDHLDVDDGNEHR